MAAQKKTKEKITKPPTPKQDGEKVAQVTIKKLHSTYGPHAVSILREHLEQLPRERKRGAVRAYKIVKPLPSVEQFVELRKKRFTATADALVDEAFSVFEELASELQEWYDNLPEAFQDGDKASQIEEAIGNLENLTLPDVPVCVADSLRPADDGWNR